MEQHTASLFTIGHSTHPIGVFLSLLTRHGISAVCDVRSSPYSRMNPQFDRESLKASLRQAGIAYVFLGKELGARSNDPSCYESGKVQYERLAKTPAFQDGLQRIRDGLKTFRVALMCAEKDPLECHRTILIARHLSSQGLEVQHILSNGELEPHQAAMTRLLRTLKLSEDDMFKSRSDVLDDAYRLQAERIAYVDENLSGDVR
ncbi:MAG: DUF488 family protein [Pseudomonadota bacterium]